MGNSFPKLVCSDGKQVSHASYHKVVSQAGFCSRVQFLVLLLPEINEIKGEINEATTYRNTIKLQKSGLLEPFLS